MQIFAFYDKCDYLFVCFYFLLGLSLVSYCWPIHFYWLGNCLLLCLIKSTVFDDFNVWHCVLQHMYDMLLFHWMVFCAFIVSLQHIIIQHIYMNITLVQSQCLFSVSLCCLFIMAPC